MGWKKYSRYGFKLYQQQIRGPRKLIGLDIGTNLTGVSISCAHLSNVYLLTVLKCPLIDPQYPMKLFSIIRQQDYITGVVIGKPFYESQSSSRSNQMATIIDNISKKLQIYSLNEEQESLQQQENSDFDLSKYKHLPYCFQDQSWTTFEAKSKIHEMKEAIRYHGHLHGQKQLEDGISSMKILDRFLKYYNKN